MLSLMLLRVLLKRRILSVVDDDDDDDVRAAHATCGRNTGISLFMRSGHSREY